MFLEQEFGKTSHPLSERIHRPIIIESVKEIIIQRYQEQQLLYHEQRRKEQEIEYEEEESHGMSM